MAEHCELINRGAEFNLDEMDGEPVLFYAAKNNLPLVVKRLSDACLDLNATDDEGKTALFYANRNNNMDVLCELIRLGAEFKLDEINGKAVLFHAAKNECKHVIKPLYDAHLDLDITDEQGKTVVFYGNKDFLDALMEVVGCLNENGKVCVNARDHYGRTPLFYAIQDNDTTKAWYLIEKGANLQLRDNCNVTIFTLYAENCISKIGETENLLHSKLFEERQQLQKAVALEIFNTLYCQASLFSVGSFPRQIKLYTISRKENILDALGVVQQHCLFKDDKEVAIINELVVSIDKKNEIDIPRILSLLIRLGTNPQATDSHGNTALHYATLLPLFGVTQKVVLDICKKLRNFGTLLDAKNHQCESPLLFSLSSSVWEVITENNNWHSSISGFAEVCKFLLNNINGLQNADTIFHRIISLVQLGLEFSEEVSRNAVVKVLIDVLELLQPEEQAVKNAVNYIDSLLNSPLHLWASIGLKSPQDYTRSLTGDFTFERILKRILDHLLKCGANVNARNVNDETPLHKCKTWTAVKLLLDAKANPNDHNTSGCSPLLAAAKKSNARRKTGHLYPDVTEDLKSFWRTALEKKLDPWMADNQGETLLNVLNKSEDFALTRALVEVACYESIRDDAETILNFIRKGESKDVQWKPDVVDKLNDGVLEPPRREAKTDESETKEEPLHHRSLTEGKTALFYANRHNIDALCKLIECDAEFMLDEIYAKAVLFHAAENDYSKTVDKLDGKNFDFNITDDEGKTALFYANRNHSMDALCKLIECDAEFMLDEIDAKAVFFHAAEYDYSVTVDKLDDKFFDLNITDDDGKTAVFYANRNHSMDALCKLIECGAEFMLDEIDAKAVLFHAAEYNYFVTVDELDVRDIDLNITDDEGKTAVFYANRNHSMDALCKLIECDAEFMLDEIDAKAVFFHAAEYDYSVTVDKLDDKFFDLNVTDDEGKTAVFYANRNQSMDALCKLIECDAEFKLNEIDAKALLFHAAEYNYSVIVEKLDNKEFDLNMTNDEGKTALFYANRNHSMDALCELIKCGAEFKLDEIDELAVLFYAAKNEYIDVVKPLCYAGLDLDVTEDHGKTVVLYGNEDFLVEEIFKDAGDYFARTSLFYAHHDDDTTKARYLIKKGADRQLKDNCNVSIFNFFVGISGNLGEEKLFTSHLFGKELYRKALTRAIFNILYCQAPLLSVNARFSDLLKSFAIFSKTNALEALAFAKLHCLTRDVNEVENIAKNIRGKEIDVPRILSSLMNLGADPQTADSDGNTAFHYATLLPLCGVTQEVVMGICKKLKRFGTILHAKNHQHQSPLLFCLSSSTWNVVTENNSWRSSIRGLFEVFRFLVSSRNVIPNSEFIFHRIISLIKQGVNLNEKSQRKAVVQVLLDILELLQPHQDSVRNAVNYTDTLLNSPLHLWASIELKTPQDYKGFGTEDFTFESILKRILNHLLTCGVQPNARNVNDETPLHRCRTWIAVKLLLDAGANPNDQNSSGSSALLVTAKNKNAPTKTGHLYPDVTDDPESFWNCAVQKGLDPWIVDKQGETIMNVLIKSEDFELSKALVEVACKEESTTDNVKLSILNVICNDESKHTHWKTILVDIILKSPGANRLALESPLRLCCRNMVKFGMFDNGQPVSEIQQRENDKPSYDDGQPLPKKARKDESEKKEEKKQESKEEQISNDSVYRKIAKQLRLYAPDINIDAIANDYPSLQDLLTRPIETDKIPILVPWASVSAKHKAKLAKVARKREVTVAGQVWYHKDKIGNGSFGSIFAGINTKDGGEVAVKRIDKSRLERPEDKREIENLVRLADCSQVVRYISFLENEDFSHVVQELMEGNLVEFLSGCKTNAALTTRLCKDVVLGLKFIHKEGLLHRDLKPENILYKGHPKICLKIADFGLSHNIGSVSTSVFGTLVGSRGWMAPEVLTSEPISVVNIRFVKKSDVFSCGMILHYILSGAKHPFSSNDCTNKNTWQVSRETETNIMNSNMCGWDKSLCPEATHLVKMMLERNESNRPSSAEALNHPLFWSNDKKLDFLVAVSKNENFRSDHDPDIEVALRNSKHRARWTNGAYKHMQNFHDEMSRYRNYRVKSAVDLVRFIRNVYEHYKENELRDYVEIERLLFTDYMFFNNFPNLVLEVYKYVTEHELDEAPEIKRVMNKEY